MISVVVPTLNDARYLGPTLDTLQPYGHRLEVIVADGGSDDGSAEIAAAYEGVHWVTAEGGRAHQLNRGAAVARGDTLLFLHADTRLEPGWPTDVEEAVSQPRFGLGAFRLRLDAQGWPYRLIERAVALRTRVFNLPYGDQALFVRKADFEQISGFPEIPLLEDVELVWRMRKRGRVVLLNRHALSAARNWQRDGILRRTGRNWETYLAYRLGVSMNSVSAIYRGRRPAVLVFCKEPSPGRVKTRLAGSLGPEGAAALYKQLVGQTLRRVGACAGNPDLFIFYDPPSAEANIRRWLGPTYRYRAQAQGDLGQRMLAAFETAFALGCTEAVIIGTDCPSLEPHHLSDAFRALQKHDVVLGPTLDGGYYLIGTKQPHAALFEGIAWSTERVLSQTTQALNRQRLHYTCLGELRDLDDREDLEYYTAMGMLPATTQKSFAERA